MMPGNRKQGEFEDLVEYLVERCLDAARDRDKDRFVEYLIDYNDVVESYLEQRVDLGSQASESNSSTLERVFSNYFVDLYRELMEAPAGFRTETISAIVTAIGRSRAAGLHSSIRPSLSITTMGSFTVSRTRSLATGTMSRNRALNRAQAIMGIETA